MSGTIVDRRDQVFTTFFSLRVFSPSTFSRRWPSTNGPFFSERAICFLYSSTRRKRLHCARRIFLNPRTGPGTRCDFGQNGHTNRVPCAFAIRSTMTDQPGLHSLYRTGSSGTTTAFFTIGRTSFVLLLLARFAVRFTGRLRRPAARVVRVARIVSALAGLSCLHRPVSRLSKLLVLTSCAGQCSCPCACCFSSSYPVSGTPTGSADDCPLPCLRRRRADGRRDSWPHRARSA